MQPPYPDQPDPRLETLINEAATSVLPTPQALNEKILTLADPALTGLLDQALAPPPTPQTLPDKIIAATTPKPAVIAQIGTYLCQPTGRYAAAAALACTLGIGLWLTNNPQNNTNHHASLPLQHSQQTGPNTAQHQAQSPHPGSHGPDHELIDSEDQALFAIAIASTTDLDTPTFAEDFDDDLSHDDNPWAPMDAYQQFIADQNAPQQNT